MSTNLFNALESADPLENVALNNEICKYFENPYLLDAFLESLVRKLTKIYLGSNNLLQWPLNSLYVLCNVRGYKQITKFLDTDPSLLELIVATAGQLHIPWKSRYILLLWTANLLLLPFDLETLGDNLYARINQLCKKLLLGVSKERDAAALVVSRLVTRSNSQENSREFLDWAKPYISIGVLQVLAHICRSKVWFPDEFTQIAQTAKTDVEIKLSIKILTRIALQFFPARSETTEDTVNFLYETLAHTSTSLRYSSAKGLARIASKLRGNPQTVQVADSIIEEILLGFHDDQIDDKHDRLSQVSDDKWHGSLLFIAEILRQKILVDHVQLGTVLDDALHFEQKRLSCSVGANVRDAACYVCWAIFRSIKSIDQTFLEKLYPSLIALACFDREVNIRRAAAAALQEGLGRHHGMDTANTLDLIDKLNFQSVALVSHCYLDLPPLLVPKPQVTYLLHHGVCSWDVAMRVVAAKAMKSYSCPVDDLLELFKIPDQDIRHGVLYALGSSYGGPVDKLQPILDYDFDFRSEMMCEGVLAFLKCVAPHRPIDKYVQKCMHVSNERVHTCIGELVPLIKFQDQLCQFWLDNMDQSPSYVVAISMSNCKHKLVSAAKLADPMSRKIAIDALDHDKAGEQMVIEALNDYQRDRRGDVGSWVRMAAIKRVCEWKLKSPAISAAMWRMVSESLDRVRAMSCRYLEQIGYRFTHDPQSQFFDDVISQAEPLNIAAGIVTCIGGRSGNIEVAEAALSALIKNMSTMGQAILSLGWKGDLGMNVLRTVLRTCELGYSSVYDPKELLRLGYNATINTREQHRIIAGVEILGVLSQEKATERLIKLCGHPMSAIRMRASEALYESGWEDEVLLDTDWSEKGYSENQKILELRKVAAIQAIGGC